VISYPPAIRKEVELLQFHVINALHIAVPGDKGVGEG
jgi:hypothetical protein